jgi:signal transduction histidine kinase
MIKPPSMLRRISPVPSPRLSCFIAGLGMLLWTPGPLAADTLEALRKMSVKQAAEAKPFSIEAQVVYHDPARKLLFICDGKNTVYVRIPIERHPPALAPGTQVKVTGRTDAGLFMSCLDCSLPEHALEIKGPQSLPPPLQLNAKDMQDPENSAQWIYLRGVVKRLLQVEGGPAMELDTGTHIVSVLFPAQPNSDLPETLIEAPVKVAGVSRSLSNPDRQLTGSILMCPSLDQVVVEKNVPVDLRKLRPIAVSEILRYGRRVPDRTRIQGVVTSVFPGEGFTVRDVRPEGTPCWVQQGPQAKYAVGDALDIVGTVQAAPFRPQLVATQIEPLVDATILSRRPPQPLQVTAEAARSAKYHRESVELHGTLLDHQERDGLHTFQVQSQGGVWQALLKAPRPSSKNPDVPTWESLDIAEGSLVRIRGICECQTYSVFSNHELGNSFLLRIPALNDITLLAKPPWFTRERVLGLLGVGTALGLGIIGYSILLRRRVAAQTRQIAKQLEVETLAKERMRIARDLHDDLGAGLTRIGFLGAMALQQAKADSAAHEPIKAIRDASREVVRSLDATVWAVNPDKDAVNQLVTYLANFAGDFFKYTDIRLRLEIPDNLPTTRLDAKTRHHVFLAVKEAINNAAKHSGAQQVWLAAHIQADPDTLVVTVRDDGKGFDPASTEPSGRHGQASMAKRMADAGGTIQVQSAPGAGTLMTFTLPI